jgi:hypothetical protein
MGEPPVSHSTSGNASLRVDATPAALDPVIVGSMIDSSV